MIKASLILIKIVLGSPVELRTVQCKKVSKVFAVGSQLFVRGTSLQSYNKFVGLHSGNIFIIPHEPPMFCRDSFSTRASQSTLQMSTSWMWNSCTSWAIYKSCKVLIKNTSPYHSINYENSLINLYKLLIHTLWDFSVGIPTGEHVRKPGMHIVNFQCIVP